MSKFRKAHCLFEQSGTFKKEFKNLGIDAYDYDIQNEFGETDFVCDLYAEIENAYDGKPSIFDGMTQEDIIFAFFPCTRFENQIAIYFRGDSFGQDKWLPQERLEYNLKLHKELHRNYDIITKMAIVVYRKGLKMIIENPYAEQHYLTRYWCEKAKIIDLDRSERGDYFIKPTQYWFLNYEPTNNMIFEMVNNNAVPVKNAFKNQSKVKAALGLKNQKTSLSMIHPDYANRFIREFIL